MVTQCECECECECEVRVCSVSLAVRRIHTALTLTLISAYFMSQACKEACAPVRVRTQEPFLSQRK